MSTEAIHQQDKDGHTSMNDKKAETHARHDHLLYPQESAGPQKPSARNTPMLSFQPHHTEISTDHPSVSGRMLLHIPKLHGKHFHFVSLVLHLRLKESVAWTRQDLVSFEIEKQSWSQTVWEKKIMLPFQDRQVEEAGDEVYVAVIKESSKGGSSSSGSGGGSGGGKGRIEIAADEWRWEFLIPVSDTDIRPESFEGSMGAVWYEMEAKCLFRWHDVDKDGHIELGDPSHTMESVYDVSTLNHGSSRLGAGFLNAPSKKAKSIVQVFGKLRVGSKPKKSDHPGDFKIENQHDEFVQRSLRQRNEGLEDGSNDGKTDDPSMTSPTRSNSLPASQQDPEPARTAPEPIPFLIRKILKLYFVKPPPSISSSNAFFLPPPSMALPTLPGTRRLKAIIPGARIQVQIQIPSLIPIRGYSQTSQLVPDPKKGILVFNKSNHANDHHHHHQQQPVHLQHNGAGWEIDSRYLDSFQVALTVRKVTQKDIDKNDSLKKRYQTMGCSSSVSPFAAASTLNADVNRTKQLNTSVSSSSLSGQYKTGAAAEDGGDKAASSSKDTSGAALSKIPSDRPWKKEIRVRKVKCEFWQKETCRIPTGSPEANTRTIKHALGQAFTYSEKDQERSRLSMHLQSPPTQSSGGVSWETKPGEKEPGSSPLSPPLKAVVAAAATAIAPASPLQAPFIHRKTDRSGSDASLYASSPAMLPPSVSSSSGSGSGSGSGLRLEVSQGSKPFMLLIPVPLDSPKLRQSFVWPTLDVPVNANNKALEGVSPAMLRAAFSGEGGSDYPSTQALYQMAMMGTTADRNAAAAAAANSGSRNSSDLQRPDDATAYDSLSDTSSPSSPHAPHIRPTYHYHHHQAQQIQNVGSTSLRTRIEVKHYLSIRLSIDLLEFEGELDQDEDLDLEAMEEQQLRQIRKRQELSAYGMHSGTIALSSSSSSSSPPPPPPAGTASPRLGTTSPLGAGVGSGGGDEDSPPRDRSKHSVNTGTSSAYMNSIVASPTMGMSTMQPALTFLNSAAGLLDMDTDLDEEVEARGADRRSRSNNQQQQQPQSRSSRSNSGSSGTLLQSPPAAAHQSLLGSAYDLSQRRGSGASHKSGNNTSGASGSSSGSHLTSGGLVAGAIGALKKKASSTGLNPMVNVVTGSAAAAAGSGGSQTHRRNQSAAPAAVTVHKLKDFVIRVPITVVIQVDDIASVGSSTKYDSGAGSSSHGSNGAGATKRMSMVNTADAKGGDKVVAGAASDIAKAKEVAVLHDEEFDEYVEGQFMVDQD